MTHTGNILTLDLSTSTGWAVGPASYRLTRPQAFGMWPLGSMAGTIAAPGAALLDRLAEAATIHKPTLIVFEAPLPAPALVKKHTPERVGRMLWGLCYAVELFCYRRTIECREEKCDRVRKALLQKGRPDKEEIVAWCRARGLDITDHNAADAVTLWFYAAALRS